MSPILLELSSGAIGGIVGALAVPFVFAALRRFRTLRWVPRSERDQADLAKEYTRWELAALPAFFATAAACTGAWWLLLKGIAVLIQPTLDSAGYVVKPPDSAWLLPGLFLGMFSSAIPLHFGFKAILGDHRYEEFVDYSSRKAGLDGSVVFAMMAWGLIPVCLAGAALFLDSYAVFAKDAVTVNALLGFGEIDRSYDEVSQVVRVASFKAPNGNVVEKPYYDIRFTDGTSYSFHRSLNGCSLAEQEKIASFVAKIADLKVEVEDLF